MITTFDQSIIDDLRTGLTPVQLSLRYEKEGKNVPSTYIKYIKSCIENNMMDLLENRVDISGEQRIASVPGTSRQYEQMMTEAYEAVLEEVGITEDQYVSVGLSADRTEYEIEMVDGTVRIIPSGFDYFED